MACFHLGVRSALLRKTLHNNALFLQPKISLNKTRGFLTVIEQYQRGVTFTLGRLTSVKQPGLRIAIPILQRVVFVDMRTFVRSLPQQEVITKDNVSIKVDAVVYYKIIDAEKSICSVEDEDKAICELAQVRSRELLSQSDLNEILHNRERFSQEILRGIAHVAQGWGILVESVSLKDIKFDEGMTRAMARSAEADRLKAASIIHAEAEVLTAKMLSEAAKQLESSPLAIRLRELDTIQQIAKEPSHSTLLVPTIFLDALKSFSGGAKNQQ